VEGKTIILVSRNNNTAMLFEKYEKERATIAKGLQNLGVFKVITNKSQINSSQIF